MTNNNYAVKVFDNIGANFIQESSHFVVLGPLPGYQTLNDNHINYYIPYLVRCVNNAHVDWEIGIGFIEKIDSKIVVKRIETTSSSSASQTIDFSKIEGNKYFYVFINSNQFNTGLNNVIIKNEDFEVDSVNTTYIVDCSSGLINANLCSPLNNKNLEVRFRLVGDGRLSIRDNSQIIKQLSESQNFITFISDGKNWIELFPSINNSFTTQSTLSDSINIQSLSSNVIPYYDGTGYDGTDIFWGNNKLLLGDSSESDAFSILPTSGNSSTIINNIRSSSDFLVYGSGSTSNLYFSKDGRLGLNMPTGIGGNTLQPITLLHLVNTLCRDAIRVDNRSDCHPASINLFHRPITESNIDADKEIAKLVMSSVTRDKVYTPFANIVAKTKSVTPGSSKGQLEINVNNGTSSTTSKTFSTDPDNTVIGYNASNANITSSSIQLNSSSISLNGNLTISGAISTLSTSNINLNGTLLSSGAKITTNTLYVGDTGILPNQFLALDNNRKLYAATGINLGLSPNKIVSTDSSGTLISTINASTFLATGPDLTWNKYSGRLANVCLRQLSFISLPPIEEFSVGDQIAMFDASGTYLYRYVDTLVADGNTITSIILDQDVPQTASTQYSVFSVTKGGYLQNQVVVPGGPTSDATYIRLSTRPGVDTIFNGNRKNINFSIYSMDDTPTFKVLSDASTEPSIRGQYLSYATQIRLDNGFQPAPIPVNYDTDLSLPTNTTEQNSANYSSMGVSRLSTGKSSYYGTYDQNGNAFEWIENPQALQNNRIESWNLGTQFICGGSWKTDIFDKLRSIIPESYTEKKPDIGFRICSRYAYDSSNPLGISFSIVSDLDNNPDNTSLYTEGSSLRYSTSLPDIDLENNFVNIPNLGRVNHIYKISSYEITNSQYLYFLNNIDPSGQNITDYYVNNSYTSPSKGIVVENNLYQLVSNNFANAPVVYISYLNAIRFINWLHNGAPSYSAMSAIAIANSETIDNVISRTISGGAYQINDAQGQITIIKNKDQKYWLPSLNEWHKAAYYRPGILSEDSNISAVTIKSDAPKELSAGNLASITIGGATYTDSLVVGTYRNDQNLFKTETDNNNYNIVIGDQNIVTIPSTSVGAGIYGTYISSSGIVLATSGSIKIVTSSITDQNIFEINPTGVIVPKLTIGTGSTKTVIDGGSITKVETTVNNDGGSSSTNFVEQYSGPASGIIWKDVRVADDQTVVIDAKSSDTLTINNEQGGVVLKKGISSAFVYTNPDSLFLEGNNNVLYKTNVDGIGESASGVLVLGSGNAISTPMIRIGPAIESYRGRILTHNGEGLAEWGPADFLRADGVVYNRFKKRAVKFSYDTSKNAINQSSFSFTDLNTSLGGSGPITVDVIINGEKRTLSGADALRHEFATSDTIAIYSPKNQVHYAKVKVVVFQGGDVQDTSNNISRGSLFSDEPSLTVLFGPPVPWTPDDVMVKTDEGTFYLGYAFSIQKGSNLDMDIEPDATYGYDDNGRNDQSYRRFKPSTANTFSIRPNIHTAFNKVAEDIDFAIYGYRKTLYERYEDWFKRDDSGLPTGITPAFYIHSKLENSFEGSIPSGIFRSSIRIPKSPEGVLLPEQIFANNVTPDLSAKICVNTKNPFAITSLSGVYIGKIYGTESDEIKYGLELLPSGYLASGTMPLTKYADLTVSGYLYTNNLVADDIYLNYDRTLSRTKYTPNAPLTINKFGQVVSLVPPAPPTPPSQPTGLYTATGPDSITIYWKAPLDDGRSTIYAYQVRYSIDGNIWSTGVSSDPTPTDLFFQIPKCTASTIEQINEDTAAGLCVLGDQYSYRLQVRALNFEGIGEWSSSIGTDGTVKINNAVASSPAVTFFDRQISSPSDGGTGGYTETPSDDGLTTIKTSNPIIKFNKSTSVGSNTNPVVSYVVDYAQSHDIDPVTELLVPLKELQWQTANVQIGDNTYNNGAIPVAQVEVGGVPNAIQIQNIRAEYIYYFRVRAKHQLDNYGSPTIFKSVGLLTEPIIEAPVTEEQDWDFGDITFNGGC